MVGWKIAPDKEWSVVNKLSKGFKPKQIGWDEGISYSSVTNIRDKYPLFAYHPEED